LRGVALKLGPDGAALLWDGEIHRCGPYPVEPLDTTGAGDCFDAGFIYGWLRGQSPGACLQIANVCGALSTRDLGGITASPAKDQLEAALAAMKQAPHDQRALSSP
jgi:sugar/nucleoside kinase (ribokinase family)